MGPRAKHRRRRLGGTPDDSAAPRGTVTTLDVSPDAAPGPLTRDRRQRQDSPKRAAVTHRSPSPDDPEMPCCGLPLPELPPQDRVTTDPALVTCRG